MRYIVIILVIFLHTNIFCQNFPRLNFRTISESDGLSSNKVYAITQDERGIMWIATANGLNKYDGTRITNIFAKINDSNALQNNSIKTVGKDAQGNILINYFTGIALLQPTTNFFSNISIPTNCFFTTNKQNFIVTDNGILRIKNGKAVEDSLWKINEKIRVEKKLAKYNNIAVDKDGNLWGCANNRIDCIDKITKKVISTTAGENLLSVYIDSNNICWVTTWGKGTLNYSLTKKLFMPNKIAPKQLITFDVKEWKFNGIRYLVEAGNQGLVLINPTTLEQKLYTQLSNQEKPIGQCYNIFVDKDNNLWISTYSGIKIVTNFSSSFEIIPIKNSKNNIDGDVYQYKELATGYWLTKRYNGGIFQYDKTWKLINYWKNLIPTVSSINKNFAINEGYDFVENNNSMYITTEYGMAFSQIKKNLFSLLPTKDTVIPRLRNVVKIDDTTWMIRTVKNGIYIFNPQTKLFVKNYTITDPAKNENALLRFLINSNDGKIFVSTENDLLYFDKKQDTFLPLLPKNEKIIIYNGLAFDNEGILWVGSSIGLQGINVKTKSIIKNFAEVPSMGNVDRVVVDDENKVWFNCENGTWCYNQYTKQIIKYSYAAGLPKQDGGAGMFKMANTIYAGASNAIVKFNNDYLKENSNSKSIIISNVIINGKQNSTIQFKNDSVQKINLKANEKNIDIYFSVADYAQIENYQYYYKLSHSNSDWIKAETGVVALNNLEHGNYGLQLKAQSNITSLFTPITTLQICVAAKWYETILFKILVCLGIAFLALSFFQYKAKQIRKNEKLKIEYENKMLNLEMQNLRSQMNPHFIFNSLNSINSFIVENKTHLASDYLTKFSRLMRLILDNSKNEIITLEKEIETLRLYLLMETLRFDKKFDYSIFISKNIDEQMIKIPPMIIQPYVENAIWHGLLQKPEKGNVHISIRKIENTLKIIITDDGIGRNKAALLKSKNSTINKSYGLLITEQRIKQLSNKNTIEIIDMQDESLQPKGTSVIIKMNLGNTPN